MRRAWPCGLILSGVLLAACGGSPGTDGGVPGTTAPEEVMQRLQDAGFDELTASCLVQELPQGSESAEDVLRAVESCEP